MLSSICAPQTKNSSCETFRSGPQRRSDWMPSFVTARNPQARGVGLDGLWARASRSPHARIKNLKKPFGILARLKKMIDFEAIDEKPVDLVFLLLLPDLAEGDQLNALASVARKLRDANIASSIRSARDASEAHEVISQT